MSAMFLCVGVGGGWGGGGGGSVVFVVAFKGTMLITMAMALTMIIAMMALMITTFGAAVIKFSRRLAKPFARRAVSVVVVVVVLVVVVLLLFICLSLCPFRWLPRRVFPIQFSSINRN